MTDFLKRWTQSAIDCYERGCRCQGCIFSSLESTCQMKLTVRELVRRYGKPPEDIGIVKGLTPRQNQIIELILDGYNTKFEIAERLDVNPHNIQQDLTTMYPIFRELGFHPVKIVNRLPEFVEYIRGAYG